ncbi:MAG: UDP-3-O-(3-hydroxymyristoyl)glucosamine N-acyltransferase [Pseudomonadota bacterium]
MTASALRPDPRFFSTQSPLSLKAAAQKGAVTLQPHETDTTLTHVAPIDAAETGAIVFAQSEKDLPASPKTTPSLVLTSSAAAKAAQSTFPNAVIGVAEAPKTSFAALAAYFHQSLTDAQMGTAQGISPDAVIAPSAKISPHATIMAKAEIGENVTIGPFSVIGPGVIVGADTFIASHVTLIHTIMGENCRIASGVRIGDRGFGYVSTQNGAQPVPQLGCVRIEKNVDIGANSTIDRGALRDTVIGEGTKIDNLVQIAHNCQIGKHVLIVSQVGISGSCIVGDGAILAGQVGIADHLTVGEGAVLTAKAGLMRNVPPKEKWGGIPAQPVRDWLRDVANISKLRKKDKS